MSQTPYGGSPYASPSSLAPATLNFEFTVHNPAVGVGEGVIVPHLSFEFAVHNPTVGVGYAGDAVDTLAMTATTPYRIQPYFADLTGFSEATSFRFAFRVVQSLVLDDSLPGGLTRLAPILDSFGLTERLPYRAVYAIAQAIALADVQRSSGVRSGRFTDTLGLADLTGIANNVVTAAVLETLALADPARFRVVLAAVAAMTLTDVPARALRASRAVAESLDLGDAFAGQTQRLAALADSLGMADSSLFRATFAMLDAVALADAPGRSVRFTSSIAEVLALAEAMASGGTRIANLSETLVLADITGFQAFFRIAAALGLSDVTAASTRFLSQVVEVLSLSDLLPSTLTRAAASIETLSLQDRDLFQVVLELSATLNLADSPRLIRQVYGSLFEALALLDAPDVGSSAILVELIEQLGLTETLAHQVTLRIADALALTDAERATVAYLSQVIETLMLADVSPAALVRAAATLESLSLADRTLFRVVLTLSATLGLADTTRAIRTVYGPVFDALALGDSYDSGSAITAVLLEQLGLSETLIYRAVLRTTNTLALADAPSGLLLFSRAIAERLTLSGTQQAALIVYAQMLDTLIAQGLHQLAHGLSITDALTLADAASRAVTKQLAQADTIALLDAITSAFTITARDSIHLSDNLAMALLTTASLEDTLAFVLKFPLAESAYEMWVVNADTLGATQYTDMPFGSLASFNGKTYGIMETGLYVLGGDDDAGNPITARFRTGFLDLGSPNYKRLLRGYLYLKADEDVILKTITDHYGERRAIWYRLLAKPSEHLETRRVKLGRGIQARSWSIEVANVDGGTLDVRDMKILPVILQGRV